MIYDPIKISYSLFSFIESKNLKRILNCFIAQVFTGIFSNGGLGVKTHAIRV